MCVCVCLTLTCGLCVCLSAAWICCSRSSVWLCRMACSSSTCWVITFRRSGCSWLSSDLTWMQKKEKKKNASDDYPDGSFLAWIIKWIKVSTRWWRSRDKLRLLLKTKEEEWKWEIQEAECWTGSWWKDFEGFWKYFLYNINNFSLALINYCTWSY